ncbi:MAG: hypothetical protein ABI091_06280 [Ferruginibacter sp.]
MKTEIREAKTTKSNAVIPVKKVIANPLVKGDSVNKKVKPLKKSSALKAASMGRSAINQVKARSLADVKGSSGLSNSGPVVSYEEED